MKSLKTKLLLAVVGLLVLSVPVVASRAVASAPTRLPVQDLEIVSYYPTTAGWMDMWDEYSHATTVADLSAVRSLGANTVRVMVQPAAMGFPTVSAAKRAELDDLISVAQADGLSVQLTLFDLWHDYGAITASERWVSSLLQGESGNPTVALVELQNEMPVSSASVRWASALLPYLQTALPGVPRTVSAPAVGGLSAVGKLLADIPKADLDAVDVHYYGDPSQAYYELSQVKSLAGGRPVFVGETGQSSDNTVAGEEAQVRFYEVMGQVTDALGLPPPAPWMLNVVTRAGGVVLTKYQEYYGLRLPNGAWTPASAVVKSLFSAADPGPWDGDGDMTGESNDDGQILGAWTAFDHAAGSPVVTRGLSYDGGQSVCFSKTGGSPSDVPSVEQAFPVLAGGETFTVTGYVQRTAGTGHEQISLAGFNYRNDYLGQVQSPAATGSGSWQKLSVTATVPAGVTAVQVHLKAGNESGRACWSDVTIQTSP